MIRRILIVGRGAAGARHLRLARVLLPKAEIAVLGRAARKPRGADHVFTRLADAVRFAPEAAVISNAASDHIRTALPLAKAGAHLLLEKPIDASSKKVQALIDLCAAKKRVLLVGYNLRFAPSLQFFRKALPTAGALYSVRAEVGQNLEAWRKGDYRASVSAQKKLGGGALLELSHEIDYLRWLFGEIAWVSAFAGRQSDLEIDVEDTAHLTLGFAPKRGKQLVASVGLDFVRHDWVRSCSAIGAKGTLRWNALTGTVDFFRKGAKSWKTLATHAPQRDETYVAEWTHFLKCIAGTKPLILGKDGLAVLKIVEAAKASARGGGERRTP